MAHMSTNPDISKRKVVSRDKLLALQVAIEDFAVLLHSLDICGKLVIIQGMFSKDLADG